MKILLAALMCLVLTTAECFALKGGPPYPPGPTSATGTYAGVLIPQLGQSANSLAIFSLTLPNTGIGAGTLVIFNVGQIYSGTLQGIGDPRGGTVNGLINATFPYLTTVQSGVDDMGRPVFTTVTVVATAAGRMEGMIRTGRSTFGTTASTRITGTADVQFSLTVNNPFDEIIYDIVGFKQAGT